MLANPVAGAAAALRPTYFGRKAAAAPATGLASTHKKEQMTLIDQALTLKG